jgi:hypothetical protein
MYTSVGLDCARSTTAFYYNSLHSMCYPSCSTQYSCIQLGVRQHCWCCLPGWMFTFLVSSGGEDLRRRQTLLPELPFLCGQSLES